MDEEAHGAVNESNYRLSEARYETALRQIRNYCGSLPDNHLARVIGGFIEDVFKGQYIGGQCPPSFEKEWEGMDEYDNM